MSRIYRGKAIINPLNTGLGDYPSMKPCIDIASADKSKAMDLFDKGLENLP